jgi:hypothetical protein
MMPNIVHGKFASSDIAPIKNATLAVILQATIPKTNPMIASGACMAKPRL